MRSSLSRSLLVLGVFVLTLGLARAAAAASPITKIAIEPASVSITADQTLTVKVTATAADGTTTDITSGSTLSQNDPNGKIANSTYTPGKAGSWTIQASFQSFVASATVTVTPGAVQEVVINPNSEPEQTYLGTNATFVATVYDAHNNLITGQTVTWSVIGEVGTIDKNGVFTPKKIGTGKVQATVDEVIGQVSVVTLAAIVTNTNSAAATNQNAKANQNTNTTSNVNGTTNTNVNADTNTDTSSTCTTLKPWLWTLILVAFLAAVAALYMFVPLSKIWPAVAALLAAGVLAYVQRQQACAGQPWWAWVITIGTIALTAFALQMRPKNTPTV